VAHQSITAAFERKGKGKVKYSHRQHTKTEARAEIIQWVAKSQRPFEVVADCGFQCLMKTGRPDYYIPSPTTVSRDVKKVFVNVRKRMAKILQVCGLATSIYIFQANNETYFFEEYEGELSFATDAWTSPNHKAFIAITVHFENNGEPMCMLLDLVEVAESHSGVTLAAAFTRILEDFGISDKVSQYTVDPN